MSRGYLAKEVEIETEWSVVKARLNNDNNIYASFNLFLIILSESELLFLKNLLKLINILTIFFELYESENTYIIGLTIVIYNNLIFR